MKTLLYTLLFLQSFHSFAQQKAFEITNSTTGKKQLYVENTRLKIRTLDRKKHVGRIHFSDNSTLLIANKPIKIDSILSVKRQPIVLGTFKTVLFLTGLTTVGASLIQASSGKDSAITLFLVGTGATIGAGLIEGLNAKHSNKKWSYKIIDN